VLEDHFELTLQIADQKQHEDRSIRKRREAADPVGRVIGWMAGVTRR
jgi:hypothetical protein